MGTARQASQANSATVLRFLDGLEEELTPLIHQVIHHPVLRGVASLGRSELQILGREYALVCAHFPRLIAAVAANVPNDVTRLPLVENLWEEHGSGNLGLSHRTLFGRFLLAVDISGEPQPSEVSGSTRRYIKEVSEICQNGHFLEGLGALGPGTEFFTGIEFDHLYNGLMETGYFSEFDLEFFSVHIGMDDEHYEGMRQALTPWLGNRTNEAHIRRGARRAVQLEVEFWDGIGQTLGG